MTAHQVPAQPERIPLRGAEHGNVRRISTAPSAQRSVRQASRVVDQAPGGGGLSTGEKAGVTVLAVVAAVGAVAFMKYVGESGKRAMQARENAVLERLADGEIQEAMANDVILKSGVKVRTSIGRFTEPESNRAFTIKPGTELVIERPLLARDKQFGEWMGFRLSAAAAEKSQNGIDSDQMYWVSSEVLAEKNELGKPFGYTSGNAADYDVVQVHMGESGDIVDEAQHAVATGYIR